MANSKKWLWTLAALPLMAACSSDAPDDGGSSGDEIKDGVFMTVNINPNGRLTRSQTNGDNSSDGGVEEGSEAENSVKKVLIVLADPETNGYIASSLIQSTDASNPIVGMTVAGEKVYQAHAKFSKTAMSAFYGLYPDATKRSVSVYVYCNPVQVLQDSFKALEPENTDWVNWSFTASESDGLSLLWSKENGFMMTNVSSAVRYLPANMDDWSFYSSESSPFDLSGINNPGLLSQVDNSSDNGGGTIDVHRMAARFDFRDGSQMKVTNGNGAEGKPFTYNTILDNHENPIVQTEIVNMSLVNLINSMYYLGRVSANGTETKAQLLGAEKKWTYNANGTPVAGSGNYVVSRYASEKAKNDGINSNYTQYFRYPFFGSNNKVQLGMDNSGATVWDVKYVDELCSGTPDDNYGGSPSYYVWRYVTENTIPAPGDNYNLQNNGQTTGVVFKAKMNGTTYLRDSEDPWDQKLYTALTTQTGADSFKADILYAFAGKKLYCTWEHVQNAALQAAGFNPLAATQSLDRSASLYVACFGRGGFGTVNYTYRENGEIKTVTVTDDMTADTSSANTAWVNWKDAGFPNSGNLLKQFRQKVTGATFTIYQSSTDPKKGWGYYCYYYYWNHHNDNLNNTVLGPMEVAVVRNNVYKLAVTRLNILGHPRIADNDPDSPTPDNPDEKGDVYMQVSVRVVPWVVRFNQIEF